jgi:hypothetical protein
MAHQKGEIYFVRERERNGSSSPFVKIGLVHFKEQRDSFSRLLEHQTGNPRGLYLVPGEVVETNAVDRVEAQLHRIFAEKRISGEWFEFSSEEEIQQAVNQARSLSAEMASLMDFFETALYNDKQESVSGAREATQEELELGLSRLIAKEQIRKIDGLNDLISELLLKAYREGTDVSNVAKTTVRSFSPKFQVNLFAEAHPEIYKRYLVPIPTWSHSFLQKQKIEEAESLGIEFEEQFKVYQEIVQSVDSHEKVGLLNEPKLGLTRLRGDASWISDIAEAKLKTYMGSHEEIKGVATWKRFWKPTDKFDEGTFAAENPDLARKFISTPEPKEYVQGKKTKA